MKHSLHFLSAVLIFIFLLPLCVEGQMSDLIISEYGEGSGNNKYMELYNGTGQDVDLTNYVMWKIINDGNWYERIFFPQGILPHGETFVMVNPNADSTLLSLADTVDAGDPVFFLFNGNEAFALAKIFGPGDTAIIDVIGMESGEVSPDDWNVAGVEGAGGEHTWIRKSEVCGPNNNWTASAGTNTENSEWIVIPADHWEDVGQHSEDCSSSGQEFASDLIISEYGEGSGNNKYMELYNGTGQDVDLTNYVMWKIINDGNWYERIFFPQGILAHGETFVMVNPDADAELLALRDTVGPVSPTFFLFNGNEAFALAKILSPGDTSIIDVIGMESGDVTPEPWDVAGVTGAGAEHTWIRKPNVCDPNPVWSSSAGTDSLNSEWIVIPADYWEDVGKHTQTCMAVTGTTVMITFRVDMSQEMVSSDSVHLIGSFNGFDPQATPMADDNDDGIYEVTVALDTNQVYEYRFVNGNMLSAAETVPVECAQNQNRFIQVGESAETLPVVCFASCASCSGTVSVTFRVDMNDTIVSGSGVHIIGSFNNFDPAATQLLDSDEDGIYEVTVALNANTTYQYRFVNGDAFGSEESVPDSCASDGNRSVMIGNTDTILTAFCFGLCTTCETTAVIDYQLNENLIIAPNPNNGQFNLVFDLPATKQVKIRLLDITGKEIFHENMRLQEGLTTKSISTVHRGMVILHIISAEGQVIRKIMMQ